MSAPGTLRAVGVIARRDIVATVMSRGFLIWLATPIIALAFGLLIGLLTGGEPAEKGPASAAVIDTTGGFSGWIAETAHQERARARYGKLRSRFESLRPDQPLPPALERPAPLLGSADLSALAAGGLMRIEEDADLGTGEMAAALGLDRGEPALTVVEPASAPLAQARRLLRPESQRFGAVLLVQADGLTIMRRADDTDVERLRVIAARAWERRAAADMGLTRQLDTLRAAAPALAIETVPTARAMAEERGADHAADGLGTGAVMALFMLISLLAGALLSNMVEEKGNKVIEILVAAVPIPAIFAGKLLAMVAVSLIGIAVWGLIFGGGAALALGQLPDGIVPDPARGWPAFILLVLGFFICAYLIYGALFLGIGSLCSSIREVQTLSMPITILQMVILVMVLQGISAGDGTMRSVLSWFPLSAPYMMAARAAGGTGLTMFLAAYAWLLMFAGLVIFAAARLFRFGVLRSGPPPSLGQLLRSAGTWLRRPESA